jgi:hypothetical protein
MVSLELRLEMAALGTFIFGFRKFFFLSIGFSSFNKKLDDRRGEG